MGDDERRARVQAHAAPRSDPRHKPPGSIAWWEHERAWEGYRRVFPGSAAVQDAQRIQERGGFGYYELVEFLGHEPTTWVPNKPVEATYEPVSGD